VPFLPGGYVGVDIFFVISGFLITSHLLTGLQRDGTVHFSTFYARRARRILPASFAVLTLSVIAALIWYPPLLMREVWMGALATAFYVPNFLFAAQGTNYLSETTPSLFQHYWSLGIEEQFYLLWPLLLFVGYRLARRPKYLFALVTLGVLLSFAAGAILTFQSQPWSFFGLPTRAWELGVGGVAAFLLTYRPGLLRSPVAAVLAWVGIAGIICSAVLFTSETPFPGFWAAVPVLSTAAVIVGGSAPSAFGPSRILSGRGLMFIGLISYSLYLVHWPILMLTQAAVGFENPLPLWATLLLGAVSFPAAWILYRFVEDPARRSKWSTSGPPRRTLLAAGAASLSAALIACGAFMYSNSRPLFVAEDAPATAIEVPPVSTSFVPSNLAPSLRAAANDQPIVYADGCHLDFAQSQIGDCLYGDRLAPRIVLFGDSHAAQWFPALLTFAEDNGYAVESRTKSSCPSVSADILRDGVPYTTCTAWRSSVIEHINLEQPALVVIANYGVADIETHDQDYNAAWASALGKTLSEINAPTVVIADTPNLASTPSICLSANLNRASECGKPRDEALSGGARSAEQNTAESLSVPYIDLTDYLCDARCEPILGDTLVYRDAHHLTATFSAQMAGPLGDELLAVLGTR
jgi:peptidoglycan/LPS O-acetylase OafA/YrhL